MKRRSFIKNTSFLSLPVILSGIPVSSYSRSQFTQLLESDDDRVLVLIQLNGGNDGLATIIPMDQYDRLVDLRSNIIIPETSLVKVTDENSLHPSFGSMKNLFDDNKMSIIQGVAYPDQNRSHFRSTDIWHSASEASEFLDSGWMGRFFNTDHPTYPEGYPNNDTPDPIAITLGFQVSETCQGPSANYSITLNGEDSLRPIEETEGGVEDGTCYSREVGYIRETIKQLNAYSEVVTAAFDKGANVVEYAEGNQLAEQLRLVAKLISGGLRTKVYVVNIGGFDTHANQVDTNDPSLGNHAQLMALLSDAITTFQADLESQSLEERVIGMTYSEFGRRIRSNGSLGTDHGTGAPLFLFGNCVNGGVVGDNPDLQGEVGNNEGVAMQYDFRSVYASLLMDWFGADENILRNILYDDFQYLPLVTGCQSTSSEEEIIDDLVNVFPNPAREYINIEIDNISGKTQVSLYDLIGSRLSHSIVEARGGLRESLELSHLVPGNYILRIQNGEKSYLKKISKL